MFGFLKRKGFDIVLQPRERIEIGVGEQVGAAGQQLADFDERGAHGLEIVCQIFGGGAGGFGPFDFAKFQFQLIAQIHLPDEVGAPIFPQERGNFLVAFQMSCGNFHIPSCVPAATRQPKR